MSPYLIPTVRMTSNIAKILPKKKRVSTRFFFNSFFFIENQCFGLINFKKNDRTGGGSTNFCDFGNTTGKKSKNMGQKLHFVTFVTFPPI